MATKVTGHVEPWEHLGSKVVMVTGASSGIGREFCLDLAKAGCRIIAAARRVDRLESLCDEINQQANSTGSEGSAITSARASAVAVELDVSGDETAIKAAVQRAWDAYGTIDVLINNAGVRGSVKSPLNLPEVEWNSTTRTNSTGTWLVSKHVCLHMSNFNKGGAVINIGSIAGLNRGHIPGGVAYAASKAAVNAMTKMMAIELGEHNIRVNSICPGIYKSEITKNLVQKKWFENVISRTVPLMTYGTSNPALTSLVRYLIHDSSHYVSGNVFIVDAGATLPGVPIFSSL